jgi:hypothetical protein
MVFIARPVFNVESVADVGIGCVGSVWVGSFNFVASFGIIEGFEITDNNIGICTTTTVDI